MNRFPRWAPGRALCIQEGKPSGFERLSALDASLERGD